MQTFDILGKKYQIQSPLSSEEIEKINGEIVKQLKMITMDYPSLDRMDILVLYIIELKEKINDMEKRIKKEMERKERVKDKILSLEKEVSEELNNFYSGAENKGERIG
jgi:flagellar motility protein MotE (MotC chaperone)